MGPALRFARRWPCRTRYQCRGAINQTSGSQPEELHFRGLRRGRRQLGSHRYADRELQDRLHRSAYLVDGGAQQDAKGRPTNSVGGLMPDICLGWEQRLQRSTRFGVLSIRRRKSVLSVLLQIVHMDPYPPTLP